LQNVGSGYFEGEKMEIDNSRANAFRKCPYLYYEQYERDGTGLELNPKTDGEYSPMELGTRIHEMLEEHYKFVQGEEIIVYPEHTNAALELEAQMILAAYKNHYPQEVFEIVDVERVFKVQIPGTLHIYTGKIDLLVRDRETSALSIIDHKTEKRGAKSNLPQKWAARDQASLYLWAAEAVYERPIANFVVNVLTRPSEKGQVAPSFPERQKLERTSTQIELAVRDLVYVADQIEAMRRSYGDKPWPANREECYTYYPCEFYTPHLFGWSDEIKAHKYHPKKEYLNLAGIPIIQP
jgi:hypothetical protein